MGMEEECFLQHLNSLNIDTSGVSFSWLLEEDNEILCWFYNNIGIGNCLSNEERTRFHDLKNSANILDEKILQDELHDINNKYSGITALLENNFLTSLEDMKYKIEDLNEWLNLIEEQENATKKTISQNEEIIRQLSKESFDLTEAISVETAMLSRLTEECEQLIVSSKNEKQKSYNVMEDLLKTCADSRSNEEKVFFSQLPLDEYFTKTELLATHMKHNVLRWMVVFNRNDESRGPTSTNQSLHPMKQSLDKINNDWKWAENKLIDVCDKLREAIWCYVKSKAELKGLLEQCKYVEKYDSQLCFDTIFEKVKYAGLVTVLEKDLQVLKEQRIPQDIQKYVDSQSEKLILSEVQIQYEKTKFMHEKLCSLVDSSAEALYDCGLNIMCLKRDHTCVKNLSKFALDFINSLQGFIQTNKAREMVPHSSPSPCFLLQTLTSLLQCQDCSMHSISSSVDKCTSKLERLNADIANLENDVFNTEFDSILKAIKESNLKCVPIKQFIWDGPTEQPNICNPSVDTVLYQVMRGNTAAEEEINKIAKAFMEFKKMLDRDSMINNLWKLFLTDPSQIKILKSKYHRKESKPIKPFKI